MQAPVLVVNQNTKRETGRKAQLGNIAAAKTVADVIRTTLGPRSMLKMYVFFFLIFRLCVSRYHSLICPGICHYILDNSYLWRRYFKLVYVISTLFAFERFDVVFIS